MQRMIFPRFLKCSTGHAALAALLIWCLAASSVPAAPRFATEEMTSVPFSPGDTPVWKLKRSQRESKPTIDEVNRRKRAAMCTCKSIAVRGGKPDESKTLGPNGDGSVPWPKMPKREKEFDGATLGPLDSNPGNEKVGDEKTGTGFAFEIDANVEGNPADCKEIQFIKSTHVIPKKPGLTEQICKDAGGTWSNDICTIPHTWDGRDWKPREDGEIKRLSDQQKCEAEGGKWTSKDGYAFCRFQFPKSGRKYGPDESGAGLKERAYRKPATFKKHIKTDTMTKIVWLDVPGKPFVQGQTMQADFVALLKGTDGKFCFVQWSIDFEAKAGTDKETLSVTSPNPGGPVEASGLPAGLP